MTPRITGQVLMAYAAGHYPEPYEPAMGQAHNYGVLARLVNQAMHWQALGETEDGLYREALTKLIRQGFMISLGEVLAERTRDIPRIGDAEDEVTNSQWSRLMVLRAENYLEWLQPLLEPATVVIDQGIKREETQ